jgi:hypothetical protein
MLGEGPVGYGISEVFRIADRARNIDPQRRVMPPDVVDQPGQIFLEMPALGEKKRDHGDAPDTLGGQGGNCRIKRRLHHIEECELNTHAGLLLAHPCHDPAERLRPRRIAGAVGKQEDCRSRFVAHAKNEGSCIPASVADWETGRSGAAG